MMKPISIDCGLFLSEVTVKKEDNKTIGVYGTSNFIGFIDLEDYKLEFLFKTNNKKYYSLKRR